MGKVQQKTRSFGNSVPLKKRQSSLTEILSILPLYTISIQNDVLVFPKLESNNFFVGKLEFKKDRYVSECFKIPRN